MIRCQPRHLQERCHERGYDYAAAEACIVERHDDGTITVDETHAAYPRKPGLGDMVAAGLSAVGITKERVSALVGGNCGCAGRQQALNELGRSIGIG